MIGVDTGFFFALAEGHPLAVAAYRESDVMASVLTRFELRRIALRRGVPWEKVGSPLSRSVHFVEVTGAVADQAAAISHGTGLPALDALILAGLLASGCRTIYTKDEHFSRFSREGVEIILLR